MTRWLRAAGPDGSVAPLWEAKDEARGEEEGQLKISTPAAQTRKTLGFGAPLASRYTPSVSIASQSGDAVKTKEEVKSIKPHWIQLIFTK